MLASFCTWLNNGVDSILSSDFVLDHAILNATVLVPLLGIVLMLFNCMEE